MKEFTHAVVRTIGEDGKARTALLDVDTASMLTGAQVTQLVSAGTDRPIPADIAKVLSWDFGGMKRALAEAEKAGRLHAESSIEEIDAYLKEYQEQNGVDFGLPKLT